MMTIQVVKTTSGLVGVADGESRDLPGGSIDRLLAAADPHTLAVDWFARGNDCATPTDDERLAPIDSQEVWAVGVTYLRSRDARVAETQHGEAGETFYDLVYDAERPELFFKATPARVVGPGDAVRIRRDSEWNVPEPEITLVISAAGHIVGHTIGNDMSSRSIEGENPLYIPQAKIYDGCAALGPRLVISDELPGPDIGIAMTIQRDGADVFHGDTSAGRMKRTFEDLAEYLCREATFATGAFLMTGTGIIPDDEFTLLAGDVVTITIDGVGTLTNPVAS